MPNCFDCNNDTDLVKHDNELYCGTCADAADLAECINCGIWFDEPDLLKYNNEYHCGFCAKTLDMLACDECCELFNKNDIVVNGYCSGCAVENKYMVCSSCEEWDKEDQYYNGDFYCESCFDCLDIRFCEGCDEWIDLTDINDCDGTWYCGGCAECNGWSKCTGCNDLIQDILSNDCDNWCPDCFYDRFFICDECGETCSINDGESCGRGVYCEGCVPHSDEGDYNPQFTYMQENQYNKVGSDRRYGIELESRNCVGYMSLNRTGWGAKNDASVQGKEFYSAIFRGNRGLQSIKAVCTYANEHNWAVCDNCGYHLHLNIRRESVDSLKAIAYAYYITRESWLHFVDNNRHNRQYCRAMDSNNGNVEHITNLTEWNNYCQNFNRDIWVNWRAYSCHKSLEIRLHEGTFDAEKIINWIRAHITFVDWASRLGYEDVWNIVHNVDHKELLSSIWSGAGCEDLIEFYNIRELVNV